MTGRRDLRSVFRSNARGLSAAEVFTDRVDEWVAVDRAVTALAGQVHAGTVDPEDVETPRRNVLAFYGVGGIGKSTFARNLTGHLAGDTPVPQWGPTPDRIRTVPVYLDLSVRSGLDFEDLLLALRLGLAATDVPMRAFDLALKRYWEINHPGEALSEYIRARGALRRMNRNPSVLEGIESAMADAAQGLALPGTVGGLVSVVTRAVVSAIRERRESVRLLAGCDRLVELLEADADLDALSFYPYLLGWDLAQAEPGVLPVVLLDTFEDVAARSAPDLERFLQRLVWLMPNTLFVVLGRNRLRWNDNHLEGQLDWVGGPAWPGLAPDPSQETRQHRIGFLSAADCADYLDRRTLSIPLTAQIRDTIVQHSHGLPLYLDLAVMRYFDLATGPVQPTANDFDHAFPALVARTFRDLSAAERHALRAVSLLHGFSIPLAAATAGLPSDAAVLRLIQRPFIESDETSFWPHHLNSLIGEHVLSAERGSDDAWSARDWSAAAGRALTALEQQWRSETGVSGRPGRLACLRQGLRLSHQRGILPEWLIDAAYAYVREGVWDSIDRQPTAVARPEPLSAQPTEHVAVPETSAAGLLTDTLSAIARRQRVHRSTIVAELDAVLASDLLPSRALALVTYYRAECLRDLGDVGGSLQGMHEVAAGSSPLATDALRGLLHLHRRGGQFRQALQMLEEIGTTEWQRRVRGELRWAHADWTGALCDFEAAQAQAVASGAVGEATLCQAYLAFISAFSHPLVAAAKIELAKASLESTPISFASSLIKLAEVIARCGEPSFDADTALTEIESFATDSGQTSTVAYAHLVRCLHQSVLGDRSALDAARARLASLSAQGQFEYLLEISHFLDDSAAPETLGSADWIDGQATVRAAWQQTVRQRVLLVSPLARND